MRMSVIVVVLLWGLGFLSALFCFGLYDSSVCVWCICYGCIDCISTCSLYKLTGSHVGLFFCGLYSDLWIITWGLKYHRMSCLSVHIRSFSACNLSTPVASKMAVMSGCKYRYSRDGNIGILGVSLCPYFPLSLLLFSSFLLVNMIPLPSLILIYCSIFLLAWNQEAHNLGFL